MDFLFIGTQINIKASSSGSYFGFSFDGSVWGLEKFDSVADAYSLCTFKGPFNLFIRPTL
jgi:hypothetical protein